MKILNVQILKYYPADGSYYLQYALQVDKNIVRKSKTYYKDGVLLRDDDYAELKELVEELIEQFKS